MPPQTLFCLTTNGHEPTLMPAGRGVCPEDFVEIREIRGLIKIHKSIQLWNTSELQSLRTLPSQLSTLIFQRSSLLSQIPRVVLFLPRLGIFCTSTGIFRTTPWYELHITNWNFSKYDNLFFKYDNFFFFTWKKNSQRGLKIFVRSRRYDSLHHRAGGCTPNLLINKSQQTIDNRQ